MTVRDYGTYFEVYVNGDLAYTSTDNLREFTGTGYGIRSSVKNITLTLTAKEIPSYVVTLMDGNSEYDTIEYASGMALPVPQKEGFVFTGWYRDIECSIEAGKIEESCKLYAGWTTEVQA